MYAVVVIPYNPERTFINILLFFSMIKASYFLVLFQTIKYEIKLNLKQEIQNKHLILN